MNPRHILSLAAIAALGLAVIPGSAVSQQKSLKDQLAGTWRNVSTIITRQDGTKLEPFGNQPTGILIFTADGNMALINMRSDLPKIASNNRLQGTPEEYQAIMRGTHAYFGTYTVNEAAKSFITSVEGSTFPNDVGEIGSRTVTTITADELTYTYPAGTIAGAVAEASWRRAK